MLIQRTLKLYPITGKLIDNLVGDPRMKSGEFIDESTIAASEVIAHLSARLADAEGRAERWERAWRAIDAIEVACRDLTSDDDIPAFLNGAGAHLSVAYRKALAELIVHGNLEPEPRFIY